ncbi:MAG: hypothetical protein OES47_09800 [Acidobacteriota bacterium]|nr:hypothetical protein [Acidobacteriota bacterium]
MYRKPISSPVSLALTVFLVTALPALGQVRPAPQPEPKRRDPRGHEMLVVRCSSLLAERELTLFGNGTLRLRRVEGGERTLHLADLQPVELESYKESLAKETVAVSPTPRKGPAGEWIEQCELTVDVDPNPVRSFRFSRVDALPLGLSRLVAIGDALFQEVELREVTGGFPVGYQPQVGDVILRADGSEFEVRRFTVDGRGVEIQGIEQPLTLYVAKDEMTQEFIGLVRRRP